MQRGICIVVLLITRRRLIQYLVCIYGTHDCTMALMERFSMLSKAWYGSAKSAIKLNLSHSIFFNCDIGVRQCDNLSPLLFALYINDLYDHLAKAYNGLQISCNLIQKWVHDEDTIVFLKLFIILHADDVVIFAESRPEFQAEFQSLKIGICFPSINNFIKE